LTQIVHSTITRAEFEQVRLDVEKCLRPKRDSSAERSQASQFENEIRSLQLRVKEAENGIHAEFLEIKANLAKQMEQKAEFTELQTFNSCLDGKVGIDELDSRLNELRDSMMSKVAKVRKDNSSASTTMIHDIQEKQGKTMAKSEKALKEARSALETAKDAATDLSNLKSAIEEAVA